MKGMTMLLALALAGGANALDLDIGASWTDVPRTLFGVFYEDVNCACDGGLYAEMVKNRSFEFPDRFAGWRPVGNVTVRDDGPFSRCPHYVRLDHHPLDAADNYFRFAAIQNDGFDGMCVRKGATYDLSVWARCPKGGSVKLGVRLSDPRSLAKTQDLLHTSLTVTGAAWRKYELSFACPKDCDAAVLRLVLGDVPDWHKCGPVPEPVDLEHVSLFPQDTWQGVKGGMRRDIAEKIAALKPGVFRFPGGCIIEGTTTETRYNWKDSLGPVENRPLCEDLWNYSFIQHLTPDYYWTYGIGYYELFRFAEELGAEPLPCVSVGLPCQFRSTIAQQLDLSKMEEFIADIVELVEFANGEPTTKWGKVRAEMGHPAPFNLKYLGVGNEQWDLDEGPAYSSRLELVAKAVREKCPGIQLVGSLPGTTACKYEVRRGKKPSELSAWNRRIFTANAKMESLGFEFVDEHFYKNRKDLRREGLRFDGYDRNGPRIFAGEYACREGDRNFFGAALMEAAFLTGVERNCDLVRMSCFAPTLANVERWQWLSAMIWFDRREVLETCSYKVQKLFADHRGARAVRLTAKGAPVAGQEGTDGIFASAVELDGGRVCVKAVNVESAAQPLTFRQGGKAVRPKTVKLFVGADVEGDNSFDAPSRYHVTEAPVAPTGEIRLPGHAVGVYVF